MSTDQRMLEALKEIRDLCMIKNLTTGGMVPRYVVLEPKRIVDIVDAALSAAGSKKT